MAGARKGGFMLSASIQGIYFNPRKREIMAVDTASSAPGPAWTRFTGDHRLGLLAARRELERIGLTNDARGVEWYGMSEGDTQQQRRVSKLIRSFIDDSERHRREAESKREFWQRLASIFKRPVARRGSRM
jgi:hypothetical protein